MYVSFSLLVVAYNMTADTQRTNASPSLPSRVRLYVEGQNTNSSVIEEQTLKIYKAQERCGKVDAVVHVGSKTF